jgi:hypothetical protein
MIDILEITYGFRLKSPYLIREWSCPRLHVGGVNDLQYGLSLSSFRLKMETHYSKSRGFLKPRIMIELPKKSVKPAEILASNSPNNT